MGIVAAFVMPHPPLAIEGVGGPNEKTQIANTLSAFDIVAKKVASLAPDTIILTSPHSISYADYFHISSGSGAFGDFSDYGGDYSMQVSYDEEFVEDLSHFCEDSIFHAGTLGEVTGLDHGTMVPLSFINKYYTDYKLVRISLSGLSLNDHYTFGKLIKKVSDAKEKRIVFIASGDLSHYQKDFGPYGYRPEGPLYDETLMDVFRSGDLGLLIEFKDDLINAAGECGHRSFCIMAGALYDEKLNINIISHEAPFGVGYGVVSLEIISSYNKSRELEGGMSFSATLESMESANNRAWEEAMQLELERYYAGRTWKLNAYMEAAIMESQDKDPYVSLARRSINALILGKKLPDTEGLPAEMLNRRAGAFVSIHKDGALRGCIGTIVAAKKSLAEEIIANAVSASTQDPRFPEVNEDELPFLEISVDVLSVPEFVPSADKLDAKKYGVIVQNGDRLGLLLPDLDGIESVDQQIEIACKKAGIARNEPIDLMRFTVERHEQ